MALFLTTENIREFVPINLSFKFTEIEPILEQVEIEYIQDILGVTEYTSLEANYQTEDLTAAQEALLPYCQRALAWLAVKAWIPVGNIHPTAGGFQVQTSDHMQPASQWRVKDFELECSKNGFNHLEKLLEFLWASVAGTYAGWEASDEHDAHRSLLLLTAKEVQEYVDINKSCELFRKMKPYIKLCQQNHIKPITGDELYDELLDEVLANDLSANNEILMGFIRPCLANYAMANGAIRMAMDLEAYGIIQRSKGDRDNINVEAPAKDNILSAFMHMCKRNGQLYEEQLRQYLKDNAATYPLYESSDAFEDPDDDDDDGDNINDQDSGFFALL